MSRSVSARTVPSRCTCSSIFGYGSGAGACIELKVAAHVRAPIRTVVAAGPYVQLSVDLVRVGDVSVMEGIARADVDPHRSRVLRRLGDQVDAVEVLDVVE